MRVRANVFAMDLIAMNLRIKIALLVFGAMSVLGCDTIKTAPERGSEEIQSVLPVPAGRGKSSEGVPTGALLAFEFKGAEEVIKGSGCRLRVEGKKSKQSSFFNLPPDATSTYVSLPPDTYQTVRLGCGVSLVWDLKDLYTGGFTVQDGQVSYLGKLIFEFKGRELETIRKAPRSDSLQAFPASVSAMKEGSSANFISGFTGRPIESSMAQGDIREGFDVFAKGATGADRLLRPLLDDLKVCGTDASKKDPLRMGRLNYVALYKSGRFSAIKERQDENAFSDELRACVEKSLARFQPPQKNPIEVRVSY